MPRWVRRGRGRVGRRPGGRCASWRSGGAMRQGPRRPDGRGDGGGRVRRAQVARRQGQRQDRAVQSRRCCAPARSKATARAVALRGRGAVEAAKAGAVAALIRSVGTGAYRLPHTGATATTTRHQDSGGGGERRGRRLIDRLIAPGGAVRVQLMLGAAARRRGRVVQRGRRSAGPRRAARGGAARRAPRFVGPRHRRARRRGGLRDRDGRGARHRAAGRRRAHRARGPVHERRERPVGRRAYARAHGRAAKHVAAIEVDSGAAGRSASASSARPAWRWSRLAAPLPRSAPRRWTRRAEAGADLSRWAARSRAVADQDMSATSTGTTRRPTRSTRLTRWIWRSTRPPRRRRLRLRRRRRDAAVRGAAASGRPAAPARRRSRRPPRDSIVAAWRGCDSTSTASRSTTKKGAPRRSALSHDSGLVLALPESVDVTVHGRSRRGQRRSAARPLTVRFADAAPRALRWLGAARCSRAHGPIAR